MFNWKPFKGLFTEEKIQFLLNKNGCDKLNCFQFLLRVKFATPYYVTQGKTYYSVFSSKG